MIEEEESGQDLENEYGQDYGQSYGESTPPPISANPIAKDSLYVGLSKCCISVDSIGADCFYYGGPGLSERQETAASRKFLNIAILLLRSRARDICFWINIRKIVLFQAFFKNCSSTIYDLIFKSNICHCSKIPQK